MYLPCFTAASAAFDAVVTDVFAWGATLVHGAKTTGEDNAMMIMRFADGRAATIVLAEEGDTSINDFATHVIRLPKCPEFMQPLVATVPLQIFACEMARVKGYDVDQPRNLAKSVTVE